MMRKAALLVVLGIVMAFAADCVVSSYPTFGPPALRVEVIPARPGHGHVWIAGYWGWSGGRYVWIGGRWATPRRGREWVPGRWEQRGRNWRWHDGRWR